MHRPGPFDAMTSEHPAIKREAHDMVVIGASSGGVEALPNLLSRFPETTPAAFLVVLHLGAGYRGDIAGLIARRCRLPVQFATDGQSIEPANVYVAPPDCNMLVERRRIVVPSSPRESFHRPSINALFRSAAQAYGRRVVGVVLSGSMEDGVAGAWEIWRRGGVVLVQEPSEAYAPQLPTHVLQAVPVDYRAPVVDIASFVLGLVTRPPRGPPLSEDWKARVMIVEDERIVAKSLENELRALHYEVCATAMAGEAALEAAERTHPDVVLMDIRLSGPMDGTQAALQIWQRLQIPIVYLTAYADAQTLAAIKRTNAYGYVLKPYEPREVHVALQLALERRDRDRIR